MYQKTIINPIYCEGITLHRGEISKVEIYPATVNTGIFLNNVKISINSLKKVNLMTKHNDIGLTEHLFSYINHLEISNLFIYCDNNEFPILEGSSIEFFKYFKNNVKRQEEINNKYTLNKSFRVDIEDKFIKISPSKKMNIKCTTVFPYIGSETYIFDDKKKYLSNISYVKTAYPEKWLEIDKKKGLFKGLRKNENMVIYSEEKLLEKNHFPKHKILDIFGDLFILNLNSKYCIEAFKCGHYLNNILCEKIMYDRFSSIKKNISTLNIDEVKKKIKLLKLKPYYNLNFEKEIKNIDTFSYLEYENNHYIYTYNKDKTLLIIYTNSSDLNIYIKNLKNCILTKIPDALYSKNTLKSNYMYIDDGFKFAKKMNKYYKDIYILC